MPSHIQFAKLIATPHETSWSQAYNAGGLFLVFSLAKEKADAEATLNSLGKTIINNIESEFFTLEEKNLDSIAEGLTAALAEVKSDVTINLCLAYNKDDILYIYLYGSGKILMKRDGKTGTLLQNEAGAATLKRASGRLQHGDTLLLATHAFATHFTSEHIEQALSHTDPEKAVEGLSPLLETTENGEVASLFLAYRAQDEQKEANDDALPITPPRLDRPMIDETPDPLEEPVPVAHATQPLPEEEHAELPAAPRGKVGFLSRLSGIVSPRFFRELGLKKVLLIVIAFVLVILLAVTGTKTLHKNTTTKQTTQFHEFYDPAQKSYDEGTGLESLNKSLAHDDFVKAKQQLSQAQGKFTPGSDEQKQVDALMQKIDAKLGGAATAHPVTAKEVTDESSLLSALKRKSDVLAATADSSNLYFLSSKAVTKTDTDGTHGKDVLTNHSDWTDATGLGAYLGNIYVLDRKNGVLKFVAGSGGYGMQKYFSGTTPDLSHAQDMTIDGSIYILTADTVMKYTKGTADTFTLNGLTTPLNGARRIVTSGDMQNLYVLDAGNSRIIKLNKDGAYQTDYQAAVFKDATFLDVSEKNNTATVLSNGKLYQISL